jgi:UDP-N-acetyl-D-glucosamine dehydrogenase
LNQVRLPLNGSRVLVAGIAYKRDVDDIRESPALDLLTLLQARGCVLAYVDPHVPTLSGRLWQNGIDLAHIDLTSATPGSYDCVIIVTDHSQFDYDVLQRVGKVVVDTRNAIRTPGDNVVRLGAPRTVARVEEALV